MSKVVLNKYFRGLNDLSGDCCTWLIEHAYNTNDASFIELVEKIAKLPWKHQIDNIIDYFESKREHPLLVKCIESVTNCWSYHIVEYDKRLFRYTIEQEETFDPEYGAMFLEGEYLNLIPLIKQNEVI